MSVISATGYVRAFADQMRAFVPAKYTVLRKDRLGRSETHVHLHHHFGVEREYIAQAAIKGLMKCSKMIGKSVVRAIKL